MAFAQFTGTPVIEGAAPARPLTEPPVNSTTSIHGWGRTGNGNCTSIAANRTKIRNTADV